MKQITLRPATDADYDFLYALHKAALRLYIEQTWVWDETFQQQYFRENVTPSERQVIQVDGQDAGSIFVEEYEDHFYLDYIALLPAYHGQGIGTQLVNALLKRGKPVKLQVLKTNLPARRLYERLGFVITGETQFSYQMRADI